MGVAERSLKPDHLPCCSYCGGVIGVYEPLVQVSGEAVQTTSRAATPSIAFEAPGPLYHAFCYALASRRSAP